MPARPIIEDMTMNIGSENGDHGIDAPISKLIACYGDGIDGTSPMANQWQRVVERAPGQPLTLVNFFKLRQVAVYRQDIPGVKTTCSGQEAFDRYAAVSMPTLAKVGGRFLLVAPFEGMVIGEDEDWDLVAIGTYPNGKALRLLFDDTDYQACFVHRTAACERQKVYLCDG